MITYDEISPPIRAFMGAFLALRKLGFQAKDIYFGVLRAARYQGTPCVFCVLRTQGKEFSVECTIILDKKASKAAEKEYQRVAKAVSTDGIAEADLQRIWQESEAYQFKSDFVLAIMSKGIEIRNPDAN
jgi:hypothetical protein